MFGGAWFPQSDLTKLYLWQSQVEIKHYSVVYFDHITAFK